MDADKLKRLRVFYHSLLEQQRALSNLDMKVMYLDQQALVPLVRELSQVTKEFPDLLPTFDPGQFLTAMASGGVSYNLVGIKTHTAMVIGRLKIAIEQPTDTPVTERRQFGFITDLSLRAIIERDYSEIQRAYIAQCWKSVIILSGGAIEAILTDLLKSNEPAAKASKSAPREPDITRWDLSQLIGVAVELKLVSTAVEKLSHSLREYRNLVHPGNELRNNLRFDAEEARIAIEVLNIVQRDLLK
jgi:hypothetical protein